MKQYLLLLASALLLDSRAAPKPEGGALIVEQIRTVRLLRAEAGGCRAAQLHPVYEVPRLCHTNSGGCKVNPMPQLLRGLGEASPHEEIELNISRSSRPERPSHTTYYYATGYNLMRGITRLGADTSHLSPKPELGLNALLAETLEMQTQKQ